MDIAKIRPRPDRMADIGETMKQSTVFPFTFVIVLMWIYDEISDPSLVHIILFSIAAIWASSAAFKELYRRFGLGDNESKKEFFFRILIEIFEQLQVMVFIYLRKLRRRFTKSD